MDIVSRGRSKKADPSDLSILVGSGGVVGLNGAQRRAVQRLAAGLFRTIGKMPVFDSEMHHARRGASRSAMGRVQFLRKWAMLEVPPCEGGVISIPRTARSVLPESLSSAESRHRRWLRALGGAGSSFPDDSFMEASLASGFASSALGLATALATGLPWALASGFLLNFDGRLGLRRAGPERGAAAGTPGAAAADPVGPAGVKRDSRYRHREKPRPDSAGK